MALLIARSSLLRSIFQIPSRSVSSRYDGSDVDTGSKLLRWELYAVGEYADWYQIHNIEMRPGQGGKLVRAAGTSAKILTEPNRSARYAEINLPSGLKTLIDKRCRASIEQISNLGHGMKKLRIAGQSGWLGGRPVVRGMAMNPIDHPHSGGEGKSKSSGSHGRVSQTPWEKPTKCGYKTARARRKI